MFATKSMAKTSKRFKPSTKKDPPKATTQLKETVSKLVSHTKERSFGIGKDNKCLSGIRSQYNRIISIMCFTERRETCANKSTVRMLMSSKLYTEKEMPKAIIQLKETAKMPASSTKAAKNGSGKGNTCQSGTCNNLRIISSIIFSIPRRVRFVIKSTVRK